MQMPLNQDFHYRTPLVATAAALSLLGTFVSASFILFGSSPDDWQQNLMIGVSSSLIWGAFGLRLLGALINEQIQIRGRQLIWTTWVGQKRFFDLTKYTTDKARIYILFYGRTLEFSDGKSLIVIPGLRSSARKKHILPNEFPAIIEDAKTQIAAANAPQ